MAFLGTYLVYGRRDPGLSIDAPAVWNYEPGQTVRVVCYTNAHAARLLLNGKPAGDVLERDDTKGIIAWDIPYSAGTLAVEALDAEGRTVATERIVTSGRPYALRASSDISELSEDEPLAHVTVEVVDENGNIVPLADNMVSCRINGNARILGVEGTGNHDMSDPRDHNRRVSGGRLLVYVERTGEGKATLSFSSPLLKSATLALPSR